MMAALLFATYTIGAALPASVPFEWEIEYEDGVIDYYTSNTWKLTFDERPYWPWRARSRVISQSALWSQWSRWIPAWPLPGDCDGDCTVGAPDVLEVGMHWGEVCP